MNVGQCVSPAPQNPSAPWAGETRCPTFMVPLRVAASVGAFHNRARDTRPCQPSSDFGLRPSFGLRTSDFGLWFRSLNIFSPLVLRPVYFVHPMKTGPTLQTGACGDVVATRNRFGQYLRKRPSRKKRRNKPRTADTDRTEGDWRAISALWDTLTEEQYRAWGIAAEGERSRPRAGQSGRLPPRHYFFKVNNSRASLGQPLIANPPLRVNAGPNPVGQLRITNRGDRVVLRLDVPGVARDPIKVYASPPQNRGRARCGDLRVLGSLPPQTNGESDITRPYIQKYGVPEPGKRIFIRTVVEANGRQSSPRETNCVVPERQRPSRSQPSPHALWPAQDE